MKWLLFNISIELIKRVPFGLTGNIKMEGNKGNDGKTFRFIKEKKMKDTLTCLAFNKNLQFTTSGLK